MTVTFVLPFYSILQLEARNAHIFASTQTPLTCECILFGLDFEILCLFRSTRGLLLLIKLLKLCIQMSEET